MPVSAVVDTNIVISAFLSRRGAPRALLMSLYNGTFQLLISPSLRAEYVEVLARPAFAQRFNLAADDVAAFMRFLDRRAQLVSPQLPYLGVVRDPKDEHVLATAIEGRADYLVTGDADLLTLADDPRIGKLRIVTVRAFLDMLGEAEQQGDMR